MLKFVSKLLGSKSDRDLKALRPYVDQVNAIAPSIAALSNDELRAKTAKFKAMVLQSTSEQREEIAQIQEQIAATHDYDAREPLYEKIEELQGIEVARIESLLETVMAEAFAVVRETAKRFAAGS